MAGKTTDHNRCARQTEPLAPAKPIGLVDDWLSGWSVCLPFWFLSISYITIFMPIYSREDRWGVRMAVSLVCIHGGTQRFIYPFFIYLWGKARGQPK